jgi:hypothetical protein
MKKVFYIGIVLWLFSSCYTEIDLTNGNNDSGEVVSAFIANDSLVKVYLIKEIGVDEFSQRKYITDASIKLFEDDKEVEDLVLDYKMGEGSGRDSIYFYTSVQTIARAGKRYRLEIKTSKGKLITCKTNIPYPVEILAVDTTFNYTINYDEHSLDMEENFIIRFKDPEEKNFYRISVLKRSCFISGNDTICAREYRYNYFSTLDPIFSYFGEDKENEFFSSARNNFLIFNDNHINGQEYEIKLSGSITLINGLRAGELTQYIIELHSLTEEGFNYLKAVDLQSQSGGLITEPVLSYTNIDNGVGIFAGYSASQKIITISEYE